MSSSVAILLLGIITLFVVIVIFMIIMFKKGRVKENEKLELVFNNFQSQLEGMRERFEKGLETHAKITNDSITDLRQNVGNRLKESSEALQNINRTIGDRMDVTSKVIGEVKSNLGELGESTRTMIDIGKDMSRLQDLLQAPKFRGGIGETILENILSDMFPREIYRLQHRFSSGEVVDAVISISGKLVPVDSKFPIEDFRRIIEQKNPIQHKKMRREFDRTMRKYISDIADKYIRPDEGTFDFALMFIPAENVYYETIIRSDTFDGGESLNAFALKKKVLPVSGNSLYAYILTVVYGLKGMEIEKKAQNIMNSLSRLQKDLETFSKNFEILGNHITHARSKYEEASSNLNRFETKLFSVSQLEEGEKPKELE